MADDIVIEDRPSWDDRKRLLEIWQPHAPLPDIGLREGIFDALLAVADWGYLRRVQEEHPEFEWDAYSNPT